MVRFSRAVGEYRLYRVWDFDGRLGYLGHTGRMPVERALEHLRRAGFGPRIAAWAVDTAVSYPTFAAALAAEKAAIRAELPTWNDVHNHDNPYRVPVRSRRRHPDARWRSRLAPVYLPGVLWLTFAVVVWSALPAGMGFGEAVRATAVAATVPTALIVSAARGRRPTRARRRRAWVRR